MGEGGGGGGIQTMSSTSHVNCVSVGGGWELNSRVATCCRKLKCPPGGGGDSPIKMKGVLSRNFEK